MAPHKKTDLAKITTVPVRRRGGAYAKKAFAQVPQRGETVEKFLSGLPRILKGNDWRELLEKIAAAHKRKKPIIWLMGAHVIKCGLSPIIIDLIENGMVDLLGTNGAGAIHDLEVAHLGYTSEDVSANLQDGTFGMARETAQWFADGVTAAAENEIGLGEGMGYALDKSKPAGKGDSLFYTAYRQNIPATVHVAIGTDIVAQHPNFDAAAVGQTSHTDFKILCEVVRKLNRGGVVLLFGSAVLLPEVFLKALAVARNLGRVENFTTANFDMIQHYRPIQNVVTRPTASSGRGFSFTGHHEFMLPLLAAAIKDRLKI
jgi:hypothetical protein